MYCIYSVRHAGIIFLPAESPPPQEVNYAGISAGRIYPNLPVADRRKK